MKFIANSKHYWPFFFRFHTIYHACARYIYNMKRLLLLTVFLSIAAASMANDRVFIAFGTADGLSDNSVQSLLCLPDGRMAIASRGRINIYDGARFVNIVSKPSDACELSAYNGGEKIYLDKHNHLWLKSYRQARCLDMTNETFITGMGPFAKKHRRRGKVRDLFVDHEGGVWYVAGDSILGFDRKYNLKQPDAKAHLQEIDTWDDSKLLLFLSDGQTLIYDFGSPLRKPESVSAYPQSEAGKYDETVEVAQYQGYIYVIRNGKGGGVLLRFSPKEKIFTKIIESTCRLNSIAIADNRLYIPSHEGYWEVETEALTPQHHDKVRLYDGQMQQARLNDVCFDHQNGAWLATETRGLFYARPYKRQFEVMDTNNPLALQYKAKLQPIRTITFADNMPSLCSIVDSRGWKWIGTTDGILVHKNNVSEGGSKPSMKISRREGLANDIVHSMVEDFEGNIWVATSYGISAIVLEGDSVRFVNNYSDAEGVPVGGFLDGKAMLLPDSSIIMQARENIVRFSPHKFTTLHRFDKFPLTPILTRLSLKGNPVGIGREVDGHIILSKSPACTDTLVFAHSENIIQLTFSALNYTRPRQTYYRVRISGLSEQWMLYSPFDANGNVDKTGMLHLPLINLKPGKYTVEVQASIFPFVWNGSSKILYVEVSQPWWRTRGLRIGLGLLIAIIAAISAWVYTRNVKLKMQVAETDAHLMQGLKRFFSRCRNWGDAVLVPSKSEINRLGIDEQQDLTDLQVRQMMQIYPHIDTPSITISNLAEQTSLTHEQIYTLLANTLQKAPRRMVIAMRLKEAAKEIKQGETDYKHLAEKYNFVSLDFFRESFTKAYGCPPEEYV